MAGKDVQEIKDAPVIIEDLSEKERETISEKREVYPTGFRNLDTMIGYRVYDLDGSVRQLNRGVLSGSLILITGVTHSGKSTLGLQIIGNMMRKFINPKNPDNRVKLHIMDVESGVNNARMVSLFGWSDRQIVDHVRWEHSNSVEGLERLVASIIQEKSDKAYKPDRRVGSQGYMVDIYPPTFIFVDAISELVSEEVIDPNLDGDKVKMVAMRQGMLLDIFMKRFRHKFAEFNINIIAIAHESNKIDMGGMPGARPAREYIGMAADKKVNGGKALQYGSDIAIRIDKIIAKDEKSVEAKGGKNLEASSISQATLFKNRQGLTGKSFFLIFDKKGRFDPLAGFLYECQQDKIIVSAGAVKKIDGTDLSCRSTEVVQRFTSDEIFRKTLFDKYDEFCSDQLDNVKNTLEERQKTDSLLDLLID